MENQENVQEQEEEVKKDYEPEEEANVNERAMQLLLAELVDTKYWAALEYYRSLWTSNIVSSELALDPINKNVSAYAVAKSRLMGQRETINWYKNKADDVRKKIQEKDAEA